MTVPGQGSLVAWSWYCRLCGARGDAYVETDRTSDAYRHLQEVESFGWSRRHLGEAESGRLLHVWCW